MNDLLGNIRNKHHSFTIAQKRRIQICMIKIGEVFIKSFANEDILKEYEDYMKGKQSDMPIIEKFLNEFDNGFFSYTISYLAKYVFREIVVVYSLSGLKNIIRDTECKCIDLNFNFLIEQCKLLEEKMFQCNHNSQSIFSGYQDYKYNEKIAKIIDLAIEGESVDKGLERLYVEFLQLNM